MEFPITVESIKVINKAYEPSNFMAGAEVGDFVSIRPCAEEYENKTFLGIYIGEISVGTAHFFEASDDEYLKGVLELMHNTNPAIFVPNLNKVIFGCESWWGVIKDESHLKQITDEDIENVWYVKALKAIAETREKKENSNGDKL